MGGEQPGKGVFVVAVDEVMWNPGKMRACCLLEVTMKTSTNMIKKLKSRSRRQTLQKKIDVFHCRDDHH
jgi:hypothetical protein